MADADYTCIVYDTYKKGAICFTFAHLRKSKTVLDSVSHAVIPGTRFQNLCRRNLDSGSNRKWGFGFLKLSS